MIFPKIKKYHYNAYVWFCPIIEIMNIDLVVLRWYLSLIFTYLFIIKGCLTEFIYGVLCWPELIHQESKILFFKRSLKLSSTQLLVGALFDWFEFLHPYVSLNSLKKWEMYRLADGRWTFPFVPIVLRKIRKIGIMKHWLVDISNFYMCFGNI